MGAENRLREQTGLCDSHLSLTQSLSLLFFPSALSGGY